MTVRLIGRANHFALDGDVGGVVFEALLFGANRGKVNSRRFWFEVDNLEAANSNQIVRFLKGGGNVDGADFYIKMPPANYVGDDVLADLHRNDKRDPDNQGARIPRKWSEWKDDFHEHLDATDGDKVVPGSSWGRSLNKNEILAIDAVAEYSLLLPHEVVDFLPLSV